jgi:hypothetical protein
MTTRLFCAAPGWTGAAATPALKQSAEASSTAASKSECLGIMSAPNLDTLRPVRRRVPAVGIIGAFARPRYGARWRPDAGAG